MRGRDADSAIAVAVSVALLGGLGSAFAHPAHAQSPDLTIVGQLGGPIQAIAVAPSWIAGEVAYVGVGPRVISYSACDLAVPVEVGRTEPLPGLVRDIVVRDGWAFVAAGVGGLMILDVRDPTHPSVLSRAALAGVSAKVMLQGNLAYVAAGAKGLRIVDIGDLAAPREVGVFQEIVTDFVLAGDWAYVVARNLMQVNIANPAAPVLTRKLEDWADAIDLVGPHLFVAISEARAGATRFGSLRVFDVSNIRRPTALHTLPIGDQARDVLVRGDRVYFQGPARLTVVQHAIPAGLGPVVGSVATPDSVLNLLPFGRTMYLAAGPAGLHTVDVLDPAAMRARPAIDTLGSAESVAVLGDTVFVEDEGSGNRIVVVDTWPDPARPTVRAAIPYGVDHGSMAVSPNRYLYVGTPDRTLRVFDVRGSGAPLEIAAVPMPRDAISGREQSVWRVVVEGTTHVYVANDEWLRVFDVTTPSAPRQVSEWRTSGGATDMGVHDQRAYILGPSTGTFTGRPSLQIVDVFDFNAPIEFGVIATLGSQGGVQTDGEFVFVEGLQVMDVRNPEKPVEVARMTLPGRNRDSALVDHRLYLARSNAEGGGSLRVLDVSNVIAAKEVAAVELVEQTRDVAVSGGHAYVGAQGLGLVIVRDRTLPLPPRPTPQPRPTVDPARPTLPVKAHLPMVARGVVGVGCR